MNYHLTLVVSSVAATTRSPGAALCPGPPLWVEQTASVLSSSQAASEASTAAVFSSTSSAQVAPHPQPQLVSLQAAVQPGGGMKTPGVSHMQLISWARAPPAVSPLLRVRPSSVNTCTGVVEGGWWRGPSSCVLDCV